MVVVVGGGGGGEKREARCTNRNNTKTISIPPRVYNRREGRVSH